MELIWSTQDLIIGGRPFEGFPILLWDTMESCIPVNAFFRHYLLRAAIGSKKSWPNTGRALYDYFSFLQANDLDWHDVDRGEAKSLVAGYRDYCMTEVALARNTTRQRLLYVCEFYTFAKKQGWVERLPFTYESRIAKRQPTYLTHLDASGGRVAARDVMPHKHQDLPKFLNIREIQALLAAAKNPHHKMMIRLALQTGLRREEIASFPLAYVYDPDRAGRHERNIRITLDPYDGYGIRTKGMRRREIYISKRFMAELYRYVVQVRGERASLSSKQKPLFLNKFGEPFADDGKRIERIVREIGHRAGIKVHTHMLRHTYATHTLVALQRRHEGAVVEPLIFVQRQLGHSSIQTTMVYLHLINELADEAVLAYDDEINSWMETSDG